MVSRRSGSRSSRTARALPPAVSSSDVSSASSQPEDRPAKSPRHVSRKPKKGGVLRTECVVYEPKSNLKTAVESESEQSVVGSSSKGKASRRGQSSTRKPAKKRGGSRRNASKGKTTSLRRPKSIRSKAGKRSTGSRRRASRKSKTQ
ncbi:hypothetical protein AAVH_06160 [Aphelenchoides avenae]|nr:hypothetical protein AAVH_06157 [Aphelenchus avenae]KAH7726359.1 hypothetical protein AAVH_06160 [Aphelenchus avenae]